MFPRCAPHVASRQRSASGPSVARRLITADGRSMLNGSCSPSARTCARTSVSRRTNAMDAASKPGAETEMSRANGQRGPPAGQQQAPSQQYKARPRARFKKPGSNACGSLSGDKQPRLQVLPMSIVTGHNAGRGQPRNSREKTGGTPAKTWKAACHGAATKRKSVPLLLARQGSMKSQAAAQNRLASGAGHRGRGGPPRGHPRGKS